ncbi:MAG: alpha/beta fold hydrolase [Candidatus Polarisedimenticolia bacterium]|nr:alpha/beta fold hydrolase [bacterium]
MRYRAGMGFFDWRGRRIHYVEQGQGPLLVVLPGSTTTAVHYDGEIAHFARRFRVVVPDLPGTGLSSRIERWPDDWWDLCAASAAALIEGLGEERALVVGTSGGGVAALILAATRPGLVRAAVVDSAVRRYDPEFLRRAAVARAIRPPQLVEFWRRGHGDDWEQVVAADTDFIDRVGRAGGDPFRGRLDDVHCPVLFTASLGDELLPDIGRQTMDLVRAVRGSEAFLVDSGRHPMIWTRPREFRRAADAFLDRFAAER